jgi:hypothetical protein
MSDGDRKTFVTLSMVTMAIEIFQSPQKTSLCHLFGKPSLRVFQKYMTCPTFFGNYKYLVAIG